MNIFYVPPLERPDECKALEENYMNCLMQKAMKDKVFTNRCVMDSLLWFHLECPKASSKFDDPVEFKRKWRNFFAYQRASAEMLLSGSDEAKKIKKEYGHQKYPEDIKKVREVRAFQEEFRHLDPVTNPFSKHQSLDLNAAAPDEDEEPMDWPSMQYGTKIPGLDDEAPTLTVEHSAKFGGEL